LSRIEYEAPPRAKIELPKRQAQGNYREPDYPYKFIPEKF
jgi:polyphosphate kinase